MYISKDYTKQGGKRDTKITADKYTKDGEEDSIYTYISSFKEKYDNKFVIQDDELRYTSKLDTKEKEYAQSLNVNKKISILPDEYQQVEYIGVSSSSLNHAYINTKLSGGNTSSYKIKLAMNNEVTSWQQIFAREKIRLHTCKNILL